MGRSHTIVKTVVPHERNTMMSRLRSCGALAAAIGIAVVLPGAAQADPLTPHTDTFELTCGAETYEVVVAGNGLFLPAHDVNSTRMFVATGFGEGSGTVSIADTGEIIDEFTDPAISKGNATKQRHTSVSCSFTNRFEFFDEDLGEDLVVEFTGPVTGFYTPARP